MLLLMELEDINGIGGNGYNRDKEENFFKMVFDRNERRKDNNNNFTSFRNSYQNNNQNETNNEISKNNYNYYKNFNYSNYINNNGALPDIDTVFRKNLMNIQNNNGYSKYNNNDKDNENPLLNSFNQHNSKFSSFAKNEIMQNIKRDKYYSVNKNKRTLDDMNSPVNDQMYNNISPFSRERRKNENRFDSGKVFFPNIYNYGQIY